MAIIQLYPERQHKIKPCPFCTSQKIHWHAHTGAGTGNHQGETVFSMCCYDCGATQPNRYSLQPMIDLWNRRPTVWQQIKMWFGK